MNEENARRLAARMARDRPKPNIAVADVKAYRLVHYPHHVEKLDIPRIPGDDHVAALSHERFHEWFGTVCDDTCPHRRYLPIAQTRRPPWWRRWFGR